MDIAAILVKYGWAGLISVALVWMTKSFLKFIDRVYEDHKIIITNDISSIDRANLLIQDMRNELIRAQEQRSEMMKHNEWCKTMAGNLGDIVELTKMMKDYIDKEK